VALDAKLKEMEALFWQAAKYQALPPDNSVVARLIIPMPSLSAARTVFTLGTAVKTKSVFGGGSVFLGERFWGCAQQLKVKG
jgi:hypothetical protein